MGKVTQPNGPERILTLGITGSGKTFTWLTIAEALLDTGAIFRVIDTDNDVEYMMINHFPQLMPENGGNVYVYRTFEWDEYQDALAWVQHKLSAEKVKLLDKYLRKAYDTPLKKTDWLIVDKVNNAWNAVQRYFVAGVFGTSKGEYFMQIR